MQPFERPDDPVGFTPEDRAFLSGLNSGFDVQPNSPLGGLFDDLKTENSRLIADFQPDDPSQESVMLEFDTYFSDLENQERKLTKQLRYKMLGELGVDAKGFNEDSYVIRDTEHLFVLSNVTRYDGAKIPALVIIAHGTGYGDDRVESEPIACQLLSQKDAKRAGDIMKDPARYESALAKLAIAFGVLPNDTMFEHLTLEETEDFHTTHQDVSSLPERGLQEDISPMNVLRVQLATRRLARLLLPKSNEPDQERIDDSVQRYRSLIERLAADMSPDNRIDFLKAMDVQRRTVLGERLLSVGLRAPHLVEQDPSVTDEKSKGLVHRVYAYVEDRVANELLAMSGDNLPFELPELGAPLDVSLAALQTETAKLVTSRENGEK